MLLDLSGLLWILSAYVIFQICFEKDKLMVLNALNDVIEDDTIKEQIRKKLARPTTRWKRKAYGCFWLLDESKNIILMGKHATKKIHATNGILLWILNTKLMDGKL